MSSTTSPERRSRSTRAVRALSWPLAAALTLTVAQAFAAPPAQADPGDKTTRHEPARISAAMKKQQPLVELATKIYEASEQRALAGFAGTELDHEANKVILYWHGPVPAAVTHIAATAPDGVILEVRRARYSLATLDAEAQRVGKAYRGQIKINQIGPLHDYSGLKVDV